jgi:hypothetical protein
VCESVQRQPSPRRLGGEIKQPVDLRGGHCFQSGENRAQRFSDSRRRLCEQCSPAPDGFIGRFGKIPLARMELGKRKAQRLQRRIACAAMRRLAVRPAYETLAVDRELALE